MNKQQQIYSDLNRLSHDADPWDKEDWYEKQSQKNLLSLIMQVPHKRILDVGCATGKLSQLLADIADEVVGIDVVDSEIKRAKKRNKKKNVTYYTSSLDKFAKKGEKFDVIVCSEVLCYMLDQSKTLKNLKKSGRYLVSSNFVMYGRTLSLRGLLYELALRKFELLDSVVEKQMHPLMYVRKSLRKL